MSLTLFRKEYDRTCNDTYSTELAEIERLHEVQDTSATTREAERSREKSEIDASE